MVCYGIFCSRQKEQFFTKVGKLPLIGCNRQQEFHLGRNRRGCQIAVNSQDLRLITQEQLMI